MTPTLPRHLAAPALFATLLATVLAGCATSTAPSATGPDQAKAAETRPVEQLNFHLASGIYQCEQGYRIDVQREALNADLITVSWQGSRYTLLRYDSTSGLPRFEDKQAGLVWLDLPWKSVLMDAKTGKPLANECKVMQG